LRPVQFEPLPSRLNRSISEEERRPEAPKGGEQIMDDEIARASRAKKGSPFLSTEQAAFYLGLSARKLQQMRAG
jgi:hypothetical protein